MSSSRARSSMPKTVAQVAQVADGDREPSAIVPEGAEQNRLLRTAARAADAAELEHVTCASLAAADAARRRVADATGERERPAELVGGRDREGCDQSRRRPARAA